MKNNLLMNKNDPRIQRVLLWGTFPWNFGEGLGVAVGLYTGWNKKLAELQDLFRYEFYHPVSEYISETHSVFASVKLR